ncbi:MAG: redoxin domain-containing protein [Candidatus Latescibacteria bacterium]|jgi:thiol-disulfide isomerase/thioredoxin|nr:redoxin domain-containing protein [Candidatus Latescibacterota bacterium]
MFLRLSILIIVSIFVIDTHEIEAQNSAASKKITINLTSSDSESINFDGNFMLIPKTFSSFTPGEGISQFPKNFKIIKTFSKIIQIRQFAYQLAQQSKEDYQKVIERYGEEWYKNAESKYSKKPVDCIISISILEDNTGENYIVFDSNNDEDLSNDEIIKFKNTDNKNDDGSVEKTAQNVVSYEYYDGINNKTLEIIIKIIKNAGRSDLTVLSLSNIKYGETIVEGNQYLIGIFENFSIEFNDTSRIWIDTNNNGKYDYREDYIGLIKHPFNINRKSYKILSFDRFGRHITIEESSVPNLAVGLPAPDFEVQTLDLKKFRLSDQKGKYILLDFWGTWCGPCMRQIPTLKKAYDIFGGEKFEIVGIAKDDEEKLRSCIDEKNLNWTHIQQGDEGELLKLYRIDHYPTKFLINDEGIVIAKSGLSGEKLFKTLEKHIPFTLPFNTNSVLNLSERVETENNTQRNILVEMFTGTWCGWCPYGVEVLNEIQQNNDNIIVLAYHIDDEMAIEAGDKLKKILKPSYPQAAIDRIHYPDKENIPISRDTWEEKIIERSQIPSPISISFNTDYNTTTRTVSLDVITCTYNELPGKYRLNVVVCEDSLNYKQKITKKPYKEIDPYYHNHVVREMITGPFGESLNNAPLPSDICLINKYSFTLNSKYNPDICHLVVFVNENIIDGIGPVLQAEQIDLEFK